MSGRPADTTDSGHLQRVAGNAQFTQTQRAYREYIEHTTSCRVCGVDSSQCTTAEGLWSTYKAATSP